MISFRKIVIFFKNDLCISCKRNNVENYDPLLTIVNIFINDNFYSKKIVL